MYTAELDSQCVDQCSSVSATYRIGDKRSKLQSESQSSDLNRIQSIQPLLYKTPRSGVDCLIRFECRLSRFTLPTFLLFCGITRLENLPLQPIIAQALLQEAELASPKELLVD